MSQSATSPLEVASADVLRQVRRLELRTRRLMDSSFAGEYRSVFTGQGWGFAGVRVWLWPEIVVFKNTLKVVINKETYTSRNIQPKVETLLEDVRTRGDRQHPFWAKVVWPPG